MDATLLPRQLICSVIMLTHRASVLCLHFLSIDQKSLGLKANSVIRRKCRLRTSGGVPRYCGDVLNPETHCDAVTNCVIVLCVVLTGARRRVLNQQNTFQAAAG